MYKIPIICFNKNFLISLYRKKESLNFSGSIDFPEK